MNAAVALVVAKCAICSVEDECMLVSGFEGVMENDERACLACVDLIMRSAPELCDSCKRSIHEHIARVVAAKG